ncbi:MAG: efflux RND transporter periplasmic adaptor subunit [Ferruginibacter sp.]
MKISMKHSLWMAFPLFTLVACSSKEKNTATEKVAPISVKISGVQGGRLGEINISGQIEATQTANISTRVMGYITHLKVKVGDRVQAGQLLVSINSADMQARRAQTDAMIAEAEANVSSTSKDMDRFNALYKQQSATAKELENVTLQYKAAKAKADAARSMRNEVSAMLNYTSLVAPFSGVVVQKNAEEGTMANPGMPILVIEKSGVLQISAAVPESNIAGIKVGDTASVVVKSVGVSFTGKVLSLIPSSQFSGGEYLIKISIPDASKQGLLAGMYVNAVLHPSNKESIVTTNDNRIMVPDAAIVRKDQLTGLYTISAQNTAVLRWVRLGKKSGEMVEVLSGLNKEEQFIVQAEGKLYNGAPVKISQ